MISLTPLRLGATALTSAAIAFGAATYQANAGGDNDQIVYSYDTGSHTARVFAFCIGSTEINLLGDTDEMQTWADSGNCQEGGFLTDPANDRNEEE